MVAVVSRKMSTELSNLVLVVSEIGLPKLLLGIVMRHASLSIWTIVFRDVSVS